MGEGMGSHTLILSVEATPKQHRQLPYAHVTDISKSSLRDDYFYLHTSKRVFKLKLVNRNKAVEDAIKAGYIKNVSINLSEGHIWKIKIRVEVRDSFKQPSKRSLDGIMGVDIGTIAHMTLFWIKGGKEYFELFQSGQLLSYCRFNSLAEQLYEHVERNNLHTVRLEDLVVHGNHYPICVEFVQFLKTYIELRSNGEVQVEYVNPFLTSKKCPRCNQMSFYIENKEYHCQSCRWVENKDVMAARNIQAGGCVPREQVA